jgi:hypothetical protein
VNDTASTGEDTVLIVSAPGVLTNDIDPDAGDSKLVVAVNDQSAAVGSQITLASGALLTVQADGSYRFDPNGQFPLLLIGQSVSEQFEYTLVDGAGLRSTAQVVITVVGVTVPNSIAGSVYADVNNDGIRGEHELGLPHVMVRLEGPVTHTLQTDGSGHYRFVGLPRGSYAVRQAQPQNFLDGIDSRGQPLLGVIAADQFTGISLTSGVQAQGFNFGERGLSNPNKKLELSSTAIDWELLLPKLPDDQLDALWAQQFGLGIPSLPAGQNPRQALDVSGDGFITAIDVLLIFNQLNAGGSGAASQRAMSLSATGSSAPYLDTSGDGFVSPIDALIVINHLNRRSSSGEGESPAGLWAAAADEQPRSPLLEENSSCDPLDDPSSGEALLNLLAEDICNLRRRRQ